jgi:hypothetical protein
LLNAAIVFLIATGFSLWLMVKNVSGFSRKNYVEGFALAVGTLGCKPTLHTRQRRHSANTNRGEVVY